jgi:DNA-binding Lrp family transcriptional regulator
MTTHLLLNERPLQVLPTLAAVFGINEAIAIQQIHWVITIKHEHQDDKTFYEDFMWCKYTLVQWGEKMPWLSGSSIFRLFKKLENDGIIKTIQPYASSRDQTKWYRIDYDVLHVRSKTASSQNDDLPSSQIDQIRSSQNDYMINRSKDLKNLNKKQSDSFSENLQEQKKIHPEQKTSNLSDLNNLEDQETPPPTPAPLSPENSSKAIAISKQAERYQQFEARFTKTKPINRHVPIAFIDAGYAEWHNGAHPLDWRKSLIEVCIQRKKKRGDESTVGAATDFIANIIGDCTKLGMWTKFQNLVDAALKLEQSQQRSQQQPAPIAVQEPEIIAPMPSMAREYAAKLARKAS